ncbi:TonB-dependent receptor [Pseudovibrio exalbescens]|uniref:TonB-dependent receptor n=1 Tax=Pseudovibrio exalbescens TaxID=197461 RepID=UPI0023655685|nr:TonB-dependent receptor [Pseudovibrio exalbescens]MDD7912003.1 TonB-dependent receptor [Pseudovibrio exalbescens]
MAARSIWLSLMVGIAVLPAHAQEIEPTEGAQADDGSYLLDTILVTANRKSSDIAGVAQSVIVIDDQQIEEVRNGSNDLTDVITSLVPGFQPSNQTISGGSETFRGRSVLIMVDGVPRNTPLRNNSRILSLIDIDTIERIEVVNGASSLYGADATGGTINIITKRGVSDKPEVSLRTELSAFTENPGSSLSPSANVSIQGRKERFDYFVSASGQLTQKTYDGNGDEMPSDALLGQGGGDRAKQFNLFGGFGFEDGTRRIDVTADWTYFRQDPDHLTDYSTSPVSPDFTTDYDGKPVEENSQYFSAVFSESAFPLGELELRTFYNHIEKTSPFQQYDPLANNTVYVTNGSADFNQSKLVSDRAGVSTTVHSTLDQLFEGAALTWGAEYVFDHTTQAFVDGAEAIAPMTQNQLAAFAQLEVPVHDRVRLQGGVRFDQFFLNVDDFTRPTYFSSAYSSLGYVGIIPAVDVTGGSFTYNSPTFNAGVVVDVTDDMQAFANFSQGYSLTDIGAYTRRAGTNTTAEALGVILGGVTSLDYSDIAPDPQIVNNYEIGLRGDWGRFRGMASGYISTSENGTVFDPVANQVSQQEEMIWGAEVTAEVDVSDTLTVGGVFAYTDGLYDGDGTGDLNSRIAFSRVPNTYKGNLYGTLSLPHDFVARGEIEYLSGRKATSDSAELKGATLVNLGLTRDFGKAGAFALSVRNVFDTGYNNPTASAVRGYDVAGQGRTVVLTHKIRF